jgi:hypothetical protein
VHDRENAGLRVSPRYGYGKPYHQQIFKILGGGRTDYARRLDGFCELKGYMNQIPDRSPIDNTEPCWGPQTFFASLDAVALYGNVNRSGAARRDRPDCDCVIRRPLEEIDLDLVDELRPGDILLIDSSHRAFTDSDVTIVFMDPHSSRDFVPWVHRLLLHLALCRL